MEWQDVEDMRFSLLMSSHSDATALVDGLNSEFYDFHWIK